MQAVTDIVVRSCDPHQVVLFGSWAKGNADLASDLDILVIADFTESWWLRGRDLRYQLRELPIPIDLHLLTPAELAIESARPHTYLNTLWPTSRCLYSRDPG